uniref:Small ribosomal subunit protein eS4 N-terminal domain-containing protein n=1 Tax=Salix viminalis TaxID=40686 RepID=A0A6N2LXU2_SALVM
MGPNKNPIDRSNRARGLEKNLKRLNAPKHWLLDKLGGAHPSQRMLASRSYFAKQAKICSHIPDMPLLMERSGQIKPAHLVSWMENLQNPNFSSIDTTPTSTSNALTTNTKPKSILAGSATIDKGKQLQVLALRKRNVDEKSHKFEIILLNLMVIVKSTELDDNNKHFMMLMIWIAMIWSLSFAKFSLGRKASLPYLNTYDGRTIHYPDPLITANYTIKLDPIVDFIKFDAGNVVMLTGGRNRGRKRLAESQTAA